MEQMKPTLSFFARLLWTEKENLRFVIIRRKVGNKVIRHAGLTVKGIKEYAFDINIGKFVKTGLFNKMKTMIDIVDIVLKDDAIVFCDKMGYRVEYKHDDFIKKYSNSTKCML